MARHEQDREDLLVEAKALVERVEVKLPNVDEILVLGVRRNGSLSLYVGSDPAYHFNAQGELRRAFVAGQLVKAQRGRLVALDRQRTEDTVQLVSHELTVSEQQVWLAACSDWLERLSTALAQRQFAILRQVPDDLAVSKIEQWLRNVPRPIVVAAQPHVGG